MAETPEQQRVGVPQRRERRDAAANRQLILAAARRLFAARGVDATSMEEIGRAAGVGQGTLYRRFAHKGELCEALLNDDLALFYQRVDAALGRAAPQQSPLNRLDWLLTEYVAMLEQHIPLVVFAQEAAAGPRRKDFFQSPLYRWLHERIAGLLTAAVAEGEAAELDETFTADAILAAIAAPVFSFQQAERGFSSERVLAGMRRLFIEGLRAHPL